MMHAGSIASDTQWRLAVGHMPEYALMISLFVAAIAVVIWTFRRLDPLFPIKTRLNIVVLRTLSLAILLSLLTQPTLIRTMTEQTPSELAVIVDASHSMSRGVAPSRLESARRIIEQSPGANNFFSKNYKTHWYQLGDALVSVENQDSAFIPLPAGQGTDIEGGISSLVKGEIGRNLAGALLITDGASTSVLSDEQRENFHSSIKKAKVPINSLLITDQTQTRDTAISSAKVDSFAFSRSRAPIEVEVTSSGMTDREIEIFLWQSGALMQTQKLQLLGGQGKTVFEITPNKLGKHVLTITTPVQSEDQVPENNKAHVVFDVVQDKLRVLHVSGRPSWDQRFLRDVLANWPRIDLVSFYVLRTSFQSASQGSSGMALIPFPTEEVFNERLQEFDVLIFQDFDPAAVGVDIYLDEIATFIEEGGALIVIAGPEQIIGQSVIGSRLKKMLPVVLEKPHRDMRRNLSLDAFTVAIPANEKRHPILRLLPDGKENQKMWKQSAKLNGILYINKMTPGAIKLAEHPFLKDNEGPLPVIATFEVGGGRTMAVTTDSLWRWRFSGPMTGRDASLYAQFWHNSIAWLTRDPALNRLTVQVSPPKVSSGEEVTIEVQLLDELYNPASNKSLEGVITWTDNFGKSQKDELQIHLDDLGQNKTRWLPSDEGPHEIFIQGGDNVTASTRFLVSSLGKELGHLGPDSTLPTEITNLSGGHLFENQLDADNIQINNQRGPKVLSRTEFPLWNHPITLTLLLLCIALEWLTRRKIGLR